MAEEQQMVSARALVQLFDVSIETIYRLTQSGVILTEKVPGHTERMYPFVESVKNYIKYLKAGDEKRNQVNDALKAADLAKRELQARELENKILLAEGKVHSADAVRRVWSDMIGSFKLRLFTLPHTAADKLVGLDDREAIAEILRGEVRDLCEMLVSYDNNDFSNRNTEIDDDAEEVGEPYVDYEDREADA